MHTSCFPCSVICLSAASLFLPSPQNLIPMETVYFYTTRNQAEESNLGHKPQFASQWIQNALLPETEDDYKS